MWARAAPRRLPRAAHAFEARGKVVEPELVKHRKLRPTRVFRGATRTCKMHNTHKTAFTAWNAYSGCLFFNTDTDLIQQHEVYRFGKS